MHERRPTVRVARAVVWGAAAVLVCAAAGPVAAQGDTGPMAEGRARFDRRDYDGARTQFEQATRANARDPWAHYWLGRTLVQFDKFGAAAEQFERAIALSPNTAEFHTWAGNAIGMEAQRANVLRQPVLARRVKAAFERAVALDPRQFDARNGLVQYYLLAPGFLGGSVAKAREQAQALLGLSVVQGRIALARIAAKEKDLAGVERELVTLLREAPDTGRAALALGNFYADRQRYDEAFKVFETFVAKHPRDVYGLYGVGRTAALSGQQSERGVQALLQALALPDPGTDPNRVSRQAMFVRLGAIHERVGRKADARAAYAEALALDPDYTDAREGLKRTS
jgi:tetratricopeptide (TPR) repeat protein